MRKKLDYHGGKRAKRWAKWRDLIIITCQAKCANYADCSRKAEGIDHIVPFAEGGTDDYHNLQPLCKLCHDKKTAKENQERTKSGHVTK